MTNFEGSREALSAAAATAGAPCFAPCGPPRPMPRALAGDPVTVSRAAWSCACTDLLRLQLAPRSQLRSRTSICTRSLCEAGPGPSKLLYATCFAFFCCAEAGHGPQELSSFGGANSGSFATCHLAASFLYKRGTLVQARNY